MIALFISLIPAQVVMYIVAILLFIIALFIQSLVDYWEITGGKPIHHFMESALVFIALSLFTGELVDFSLMGTTKLLLLYTGIRFAFYDFILNLLRGKPLLYLGDIENESLEDKYLRKFHVSQYFLKATFLILTIIINIL